MPRFLKPCVAILTLALLCGSPGNAQTASKPLTKGQLLALVAGNALSENAVHHVGVEGIGFRPSALPTARALFLRAERGGAHPRGRPARGDGGLAPEGVASHPSPAERGLPWAR